MMDIRKLILERLDKEDSVKASDIVKATGFSRAYINRFFQQLRDEGQVVLIGKANKAVYIRAAEGPMRRAQKNILYAHRMLGNENLSEDIVLADVKNTTGIFMGIRENIKDIVHYAFLEMLNNAIEHSRSEEIEIRIKRERTTIWFAVVDAGIGIFNNIMKTKNLRSEIEAIQDLIKGKQTSMPKAHSGEGIFFTSKAADILIIESSHKKLIFNNLIKDIFIRDIKNRAGTKVTFSTGLVSRKNLEDIFKHYTDESFQFSKTRVTVKLYRMGSDYISRSQARRVLSGLEKFRTVVLDFSGVKTVGQSFADEVFRVWGEDHPDVTIIAENGNENITFMINRARSRQ